MPHQELLSLTSIYTVFEPVVFIGLILLLMRSLYWGWMAHELIDHDRFAESGLCIRRGWRWSIALVLVTANIWWLAGHFVLLNAVKWIGSLGSLVCLLLIYQARRQLQQLGYKRK